MKNRKKGLGLRYFSLNFSIMGSPCASLKRLMKIN